MKKIDIQKISEKRSGHNRSKNKDIVEDYYGKIKTKIALDMSKTLQIIYIFTMSSTFIITLLVGFKFYGFTLDPITYIVSVASFLTFTGITTFITKLLK